MKIILSCITTYERSKKFVKMQKPSGGSNQVKDKERLAKFIKRITDELCPQATKITLVMDNYGTHKASAFYEMFQPERAKRLWDRFEFVYTPKHGSWLNMAEIENHVMSGQYPSFDD